MRIQDFFQKGYYINLDRRIDRQKHFQSEVTKVGLPDFFERFSGHDCIDETEPLKRHYYCGSSYSRLFHKIINDGYERVLIFEDDIEFYNGGQKSAIQIIEESLDDIKKFSDWDMLYFGGHPLGTMFRVSDYWSVPENVLAMHAVGYTRRGIEKLLRYKPFADSAIDGWVSARPYIRKYMTNCLTISQASGDSDLDAFGKSVGPLGFLSSYKKAKIKPAKNMTERANVLENNFITPRLQGRTGNLLFQIAHAYVKALEYDRQFIVPAKEAATVHLEKGLFRKFDFKIETLPSPEKSKYIWGPFTYGEVGTPADNMPTVYAGWYQSEKFFGRYKKIIRDVFSPTPEFINSAYTDFPFLSTRQVAAINVRRGDYLTQPRRHPVVTKKYIDEAISKLPYHDIKLVISDDIEWCKKNLVYEDVVFADKYYDEGALWLLSLCDHYVISNSTFSWWGAWLSRNENKTVVSPSTWFGPDVAENPMDIWCDGWIKIPTKWEDGQIVVI